MSGRKMDGRRASEKQAAEVRGRRDSWTEKASPEAELRHVWMRNTQNVDCLVHIWTPLDESSRPASPRGVVVIFHGMGGHGLFPTVRYLAELLVQYRYAVYSMDFCGHGQSYGLRGYIESPQLLLNDGRLLCELARDDFPGWPFFLAGGSMGGSVALLLSLEVPYVDGLILMAPMVSLPVASWQKWVVDKVASWTPKFGLIKPASSNAALACQFRDEERRDEIRRDCYVYKGRLRAATANTCMQLAQMVHGSLDQFSAPLLCLLAREDYVVDNDGIDDLMEQCISQDKTLKEYDALHGLLCEEEPLRGEIENDVVTWISQRTLD